MFPDLEDPSQDAGAPLRAGGGVPGVETGDRAWSLETLGRVAEGVVHDFNNVLTAISGLAELMLHPRAQAAGGDGAGQAGPGESAAQEFARMIHQAALSGQGLVKDLRALARQGGKTAELLDLHEVIGQSIAIARGALGGRVYVASSLAPEPARVLGCRSLLQNVFINLFLNARDAMPRGGRIVVRTEMLPAPGGTGRPAVCVTVQDSGEGMQTEVLRRIFEPGFTTKGAKGSGLGLANVMRTITHHRGSIEADSTPGAGTAFRIRLPRLG